MLKCKPRPFKIYKWAELLKIRDSLQVLCDTMYKGTPEWVFMDEMLAEVSNDIDIRYKKNEREG